MKRKILGDHRIKSRDESNNDNLRIREFCRRILCSGYRNANRIDSLSFQKTQSYKFEVPDIAFVRQSEYFKAYGNRLSWNRCRTRCSSFKTQHRLIDSNSRARKLVILTFLAQIIEYSTVFMLIGKFRMRPRSSILKIKHFQNRFSTIFRNRDSG